MKEFEDIFVRHMLEDILDQCIEDVKAGKSSIEEFLDKYPSVRKQLEPLLRINLEVRKKESKWS